MQSSLHKLLEDVFDEQELALIINAAFLHVSNLDNADDIQAHMQSFNGGWGSPLKRLERVRENLRSTLAIATTSDSFSFRPILNEETAVSDGAYHNAVVLNEIHRKEKRGKVQSSGH